MKKIIATLAVLALSNAGIALAQTTDAVVTPPTTMASTSTSQVAIDVREAEAKIKILREEMRNKIEIIRAEYKSKIDAIRLDLKAKKEAIRREAQIKREADKMKRKEEAAKARLEAKNKRDSEIHSTASTTTTGGATQ